MGIGGLGVGGEIEEKPRELIDFDNSVVIKGKRVKVKEGIERINGD